MKIYDELVLWGFHPSYCNGEPIKLGEFSATAWGIYQSEGWTCAAYKRGDEPTGLRDQARAAKK